MDVLIDTRLAGLQGAHHVFLHGTLRKLHGLGDFGVFAPVDTVEQEDLPGFFRQSAQCRFDVAQIIARLQRRLGFVSLGPMRIRQQILAEPGAAALIAQVVNGDIAGAAQQVRVELLDLHQRTPPEPEKQVLDEVRRCRPATHSSADQRLHLRTLGQKHLQKPRARSFRRLVVEVLTR